MTRPTLARRLRWRLAVALWRLADGLDAVRAGGLADRLDDLAAWIDPRAAGGVEAMSVAIHDDCAVHLTRHACGCIVNSVTGLHRPCPAIAVTWSALHHGDSGSPEATATLAELSAAVYAHLAASGKAVAP